MIEVLKTVNPVDISYAQALLKDAGIVSHVFDASISALEGSIGAFPRRILVSDEHANEARRLLKDAGIEPFEE